MTYKRNEIAKTVISTTRGDLRKEIVNWFLDEKPGQGKNDLASRYRYIVETFKEYSVVLDRPAYLNKGFDFAVKIIKTRPNKRSEKLPKVVEEIKFKSNELKKAHSAPSYEDLTCSLRVIKDKFPSEYDEIVNLIDDIFKCSNSIGNNINKISVTFVDKDGNEHPYAVMLLALKWLFIEQDLTYWNFSGREMLYNKIKG